ncbi:RNA polymerase sigma factor [Sinanaerobacter chloroacetimidivorans]|uniref:Sigma-70 family RNA polymerase sigma factor n=1 Tax=Sinanaerobacter chloroacetimidivorans TaxID=2818044 RepID=A0A8J7VWL3_9FIRM|nr:sigma-70 family RNA polymerase sigma factor [Sinanaerobacter chloroacetimidivorans]MBR0596354.1 sigma-70 family RNA polymerase sigma factor [Sinanaerobacter chloroacetimidivorans]
MQDIEKFYNDYFQTVFKYLFCMTHDADISEELTQETFYQAVKTYDNFRGDCKVSVWLCQIAKHLWYKEYRSRNKYTSDSIDEISDSFHATENVEHIILESDSKIALYQKLQTLDEKTREVIYLRLTGELSFREIGEILNRNETWARVTFYRGKQKLMKEGQ